MPITMSGAAKTNLMSKRSTLYAELVPSAPVLHQRSQKHASQQTSIMLPLSFAKNYSFNVELGYVVASYNTEII